MLIENFQSRYTSVPLATFSRVYKKNSQTVDFGTLPHIHKELEILLVLDGEAKLQINSVSHTIREGNIVVIAPYTLHGYTIFAHRNFSHYCLCFDLDILYDKQLKTRLENGTASIVNIIESHPLCSEYIKNIFIANREKKSGWEMLAAGNIHLLMGMFAACGYLKTNAHIPARSVYQQIFDYIAKHHREDITSSAVATHLGFNNSYFCRLFHRSFGDAFQNYLCKFRIEKSKQLLRYTDTPISLIATEVGFNSFSYFSKKFKEYTHATPTAYRMNK